MAAFEYIFAAIRGIQGGREYYVAMCPLEIIPRIFLFDEDELRPELRAQRTLNKTRIPEISRYILDHPKSYVFSALTASVDGKVIFEPLGSEESERSLGRLRVPMNARFVINDGQHRRAAIEAALLENPDLRYETISVVFFLDVGLKRCQQMFADLNRHAIRPNRSLGLLYDHRDEAAQSTKAVMQKVPVFAELCETERSNISNRSIKLFTLSGIHSATRALLSNIDGKSADEKIELAVEFWNGVASHIDDWQLAKDRKVSAADLRRDYIHAHTLALAAIARAGNAMIVKGRADLKNLRRLSTIDWSRGNVKLWEGRAMTSGRLSKRSVNVALTGNAIKQHLGLELTAEEQQLEDEFRSARNGRRHRR